MQGSTEELRLTGFNAPELDQCGGVDAKTALAELLQSGAVELTVDPDDERDRFGRLLGTLSVDGAPVAASLARAGAVFPLGGSSSPLFEDTLEATRAGKGVWNPSRCEPATGGLVIDTFVPNPAGNDNQPGAGEYLELRNDTVSVLPLANWVVRDESFSNLYVFAGGALEPGQTIRLYSTCGDDDGQTRFWCSASPVWSNSGDTALVLDPSGNVVDYRFSP